MVLRATAEIYPDMRNGFYEFDLSLVEVDKNIDPIAVNEPGIRSDKIWQVVGIIFYYLFFPITFAMKLIVTYVYPFNLLTELVGRATIFATDLINPLFSEFGPWFLKNLTPFVPMQLDRIARAKEQFLQLGAEFTEILSPDNEKIEMMRITQKEFINRLVAAGGEFEIKDGKEIVKNLSDEFQSLLIKMGFHQMDGGIVIRTELSSGDGATSSSGLVFRIHPNSHLMVTEKNLIANHLILGKDFVSFDTRGYREGNSLCSEAGIYLDAMTVYEQVLNWGYLPQDIWVTAKCGGSPAVLFLKERYGHDFNMVLENSYLDKKRTDRQNVPLAHYIGWDILQCLDTKKEETIQVIRNLGLEHFCDRFENESKLRRIDAANENRKWQGKTVIISAQRDLSVEPEAGYELSRLAAKVSKHCYHLIHALPDDQADGHRDQALVNDHQLIRVYSQILLKAGVDHDKNEVKTHHQPLMTKSLESLRFQQVIRNPLLDI